MERERRALLHRALAPPPTEPVAVDESKITPIQPQFIPWRVRQQMMEAEDRKKAQLMKDRSQEIEDLEKELEIHATEK